MTATMAMYLIVFLGLFLFAILLPYGKILPIYNNHISSRKDSADFHWNLKTALVLLSIGLIAGFRDTGMGTDYAGYIDFYEYLLNHKVFMTGPLIGSEIGWNYANLWIARLGIPYELFFGLVTAITWFFFIKGSYRFQYLLPLMFFFVISTGFFFWTLSGLRQSITIMLFFFSIRYILERNIYMYMITIGIGSLFHISILMMIPIYFLNKIKINRAIALFLFLISIAFIGNNLFILVSDTLMLYLGQLGHLSVYAHYLEQDKMLEMVESTGTNLGFILKSIFTIWIIFKSKKILKIHNDLNIYYLLFIIYAILNNLFFGMELIARVLNYFYMCFPIVAASVIYFSNTKIEKIVAFVFLCAFTLLYIVTTYKFVHNALS